MPTLSFIWESRDWPCSTLVIVALSMFNEYLHAAKEAVGISYAAKYLKSMKWYSLYHFFFLSLFSKNSHGICRRNMIFCILKMLSRYLVEKNTHQTTKPTTPNILCHESLFEGKIITIKMIAFWGIIYLFSR